jgi:hypothetical protein
MTDLLDYQAGEIEGIDSGSIYLLKGFVDYRLGVYAQFLSSLPCVHHLFALAGKQHDEVIADEGSVLFHCFEGCFILGRDCHSDLHEMDLAWVWDIDYKGGGDLLIT